MYSDLSSVAVMVIYRMIGNPYNQNILKRISILTTHTILMILYYPYILTLSIIQMAIREVTLVIIFVILKILKFLGIQPSILYCIGGRN